MEENKYFEQIKSFKFLAKKEIGQNFLINKEVCKNIVNSIDINKDDYVLEVGCGFGSLSYYLNNGAEKFDCIDIDERCVDYLNENLSLKNDGHVFVANVLDLDLSKYTKIISNLPYYITTNIIERVLLNASNIKKCVFMTQKEAYQRLTAGKNTKDYSALNILIKYMCTAKEITKVNRNNFTPIPNVDSVVFSFTFDKELDLDINFFYKVLKACFSQRRKTLYNNLKSLELSGDVINNVLLDANIPNNTRCEQLDLEEYKKLTKILKQYF